MRLLLRPFSWLSGRYQPWGWTFLLLIAVSMGLFLGLCLRSKIEATLPIQGLSSSRFCAFEFIILFLLALLLWKFCVFVLAPLRGRSVFALLYEISCDFRACVDTYSDYRERKHAIGELRQVYEKSRIRLLVLTTTLVAILYVCLVCLVASGWFLGTAYAGFSNSPVLEGEACGTDMGMFGHVYFSLVTLTTLGYGDIHPANQYGFVMGVLTIVVGIGIYGTAFVGFINVWPETFRRVEREIHRQIAEFGNDETSLEQLLDEA